MQPLTNVTEEKLQGPLHVVCGAHCFSSQDHGDVLFSERGAGQVKSKYGDFLLSVGFGVNPGAWILAITVEVKPFIHFNSNYLHLAKCMPDDQDVPSM